MTADRVRETQDAINAEAAQIRRDLIETLLDTPARTLTRGTWRRLSRSLDKAVAKEAPYGH